MACRRNGILCRNRPPRAPPKAHTHTPVQRSALPRRVRTGPGWGPLGWMGWTEALCLSQSVEVLPSPFFRPRRSAGHRQKARERISKSVACSQSSMGRWSGGVSQSARGTPGRLPIGKRVLLCVDRGGGDGPVLACPEPSPSPKEHPWSWRCTETPLLCQTWNWPPSPNFSSNVWGYKISFLLLITIDCQLDLIYYSEHAHLPYRVISKPPASLAGLGGVKSGA